MSDVLEHSDISFSLLLVIFFQSSLGDNRLEVASQIRGGDWREMKRQSNHFSLSEAFISLVDRERTALQSRIEEYTDARLGYQAIIDIFGAAVQIEGSSNRLDEDDELGEIARQIAVRSVVCRRPWTPYFELTHLLRDAIRPLSPKPIFDIANKKWESAVRIAIALQLTSHANICSSFRPRARDLTYAHAINYFRKKNISIPVIDGRVAVDDERTRRQIVETVSHSLFLMGDHASMGLIRQQLNVLYDPRLKRVRLHPTPDSMGRKLNRTLPFGYFYRMAIRVLGSKKQVSFHQRGLQNLQEALVAIGALYDVEPFDLFQLIFPPRPKFGLKVLQDIVVHDELFSVPQSDPAVIEGILLRVFDGLLTESVALQLGWDAGALICFWRVILRIGSLDGAPVFIEKSALLELLSQHMSSYAAHAILNSFVFKNPNAQYGLPTDAAYSDTRECALAYASEGNLWIAPRPFVGPAFFSRLVTVVGAIDQNIHSNMGKNFENIFAHKFREQDFSVKRGVIKSGKNILGDADLIVETPDTVVLFELKKKGLRRIANSGNDVDLIADLARGAIHAVNQLGKLESILLKNGQLDFVDGTSLWLNRRMILKVVVSLSDHGGLHDETAFRHMLCSLRGATLTSTRELSLDQMESLRVANDQLAVLHERFTTFESLKPRDSTLNFSDNVVFHNIFFIEFLLGRVGDPEDFVMALRRGHRLSNGTRDAFVTFAQFDGLLTETGNN